jgi:hypothetical protein
MHEPNIEFNADEWYDHQRRKIVWFTAVVDDKVIDCGITMDALRERFAAYADDPLPAFRSHRARVQEIASDLIRKRRFDDDGNVIIRTADFRP